MCAAMFLAIKADAIKRLSCMITGTRLKVVFRLVKYLSANKPIDIKLDPKLAIDLRRHTVVDWKIVPPQALLESISNDFYTKAANFEITRDTEAKTSALIIKMTKAPFDKGRLWGLEIVDFHPQARNTIECNHIWDWCPSWTKCIMEPTKHRLLRKLLRKCSWVYFNPRAWYGTLSDTLSVRIVVSSDDVRKSRERFDSARTPKLLDDEEHDTHSNESQEENVMRVRIWNNTGEELAYYSELILDGHRWGYERFNYKGITIPANQTVELDLPVKCREFYDVKCFSGGGYNITLGCALHEGRPIIRLSTRHQIEEIDSNAEFLCWMGHEGPQDGEYKDGTFFVKLVPPKLPALIDFETFEKVFKKMQEESPDLNKSTFAGYLHIADWTRSSKQWAVLAWPYLCTFKVKGGPSEKLDLRELEYKFLPEKKAFELSDRFKHYWSINSRKFTFRAPGNSATEYMEQWDRKFREAYDEMHFSTTACKGTCDEAPARGSRCVSITSWW
uniref:Uncharacterized protein n=1 Tax=Lotharella oceanica TaxID=641309 RepID=A0A7S2THW9_9EUKA